VHPPDVEEVVVLAAGVPGFGAVVVVVGVPSGGAGCGAVKLAGLAGVGVLMAPAI
jgi:hypothetical protein